MKRGEKFRCLMKKMRIVWLFVHSCFWVTQMCVCRFSLLIIKYTDKNKRTFFFALCWKWTIHFANRNFCKSNKKHKNVSIIVKNQLKYKTKPKTKCFQFFNFRKKNENNFTENNGKRQQKRAFDWERERDKKKKNTTMAWWVIAK